MKKFSLIEGSKNKEEDYIWRITYAVTLNGVSSMQVDEVAAKFYRRDEFGDFEFIDEKDRVVAMYHSLSIVNILKVWIIEEDAKEIPE